MNNRYANGRYSARHTDWHASDAAHKAGVVLRALQAMGWRPNRIVDIGCGTGDVLRHLKAHLDPRGEQGLILRGWDPYAPLATGQPGVELSADPVVAAGWRADVVLCLDVAEHVTDPITLLTSLRRWSDRLVVRLPLDLSALDALRPARALTARRDLGHLHAWTLDLARQAVAESGWTSQWEELERVPPHPSGLRGALTGWSRSAAAWVNPELTARAIGGLSLTSACVPAMAGNTEHMPVPG